MTQTMGDMAKKAGQGVQDQTNDFMTHAERTLQSMRPALESALQAIRKHPAQAAGDAAAMGIDMTGRLAKTAMSIAGGLADGLRGAVGGSSEESSRKPDAPDEESKTSQPHGSGEGSEEKGPSH